MELLEAVRRIELGESLAQIAESRRIELLSDCGLDPDDARPDTFRKEAHQFVAKLARHLGDRHFGDGRIADVLAQWTRFSDDYDVYDALLANFTQFDGREQVLQKGRVLFPGTLTGHWDER
ncbi:MAG: hypothetical protein AAF196_08760 [Planctomycetota bacterium]